MTIATYKNHKYECLWIGKCKNGKKRAHLKFYKGDKDFWVDASQVQIENESVRTASREMCAECGEYPGKYSRRDSSGIPGKVCGRCNKMRDYEMSFA